MLDEIENVLGIRTCPMNWPIGSGKEFKGVYDRETKMVDTFEAISTGGAKKAAETQYHIEDQELKDLIGPYLYDQFKEEMTVQPMKSISRRFRRESFHPYSLVLH